MWSFDRTKDSVWRNDWFVTFLFGKGQRLLLLELTRVNCPALLIDNGPSVMSIPLAGTNGTENELGLTRGVLPRRPLFPGRSLSPGETDDQTRWCSFDFSFVLPVRSHRGTSQPVPARGKRVVVGGGPGCFIAPRAGAGTSRRLLREFSKENLKRWQRSLL